MSYFLLASLCVLFGCLVSVAPVQAGILGGLLAGIMLLFALRARLAVWATIVVCYVLVGPAESLGRVPKVFWISYLLGLFLFAKAILLWMNLRPQAGPRHRNAFVSPAIMLFSTFAFIVVFSSIAAEVDIFQLILGSRDYLWLWGFFALAVASRFTLRDQATWLRFLPLVVVIQVPLTIYQHFFVISATNFTSRDAVVGLFGGNPEGGGASGAMGFFSLLMALYTIARMRNGCASRWLTLLVVGSALISIGLAEVKYVAIAAPLVAIAFFGVTDILRSARTLAWIMLFIAAGPVILYGYWKTFEAPGAKGFGSFERYVTVMLERNVDDRQIAYATGEMGRVTAIRFWSQKNNFTQDPVGTTVGHGIGASRIGFFVGEVARKYPFNVARSSLSVLLWETGLAGAGCAFFLLLMGWQKAKRLMKAIPQSNGESRAAIQLVAAVFVTALLCLPYNTDMVGTPQFQLLLVMCTAALWAGYHAHGKEVNAANSCGSAVETVISMKRRL